MDMNNPAEPTPLKDPHTGTQLVATNTGNGSIWTLSVNANGDAWPIGTHYFGAQYQGTDFTEPPAIGNISVTVTGSVSSITSNSGGGGCPTNGSAVPVTLTGGGYSTIATATANISGGGVQSFAVTGGGGGYTSYPTVSVSGCTTQPTSTVVMAQ